MESGLKLGEKKILQKIKEECDKLATENNRPVGIYYDRKIKEILSEYKSNPSEKTKEQYRNVFNRLIKDPRNKGSALSIMLLNANSRASFDLYRSAFRFCMAEIIEKKRKESEYYRSIKDYDSMKKSTMEALKLSVVFQYQFLSHEKITFSDVKTKDNYKKQVRSKKKDLKNLVEYSDMVNSLNPIQKEKYSIPLTIYGLFGIRPAELQKGIKLACEEEDGKKVVFAEIEGAKVNKIKGQEKRYCKIFLDTENSADMEFFDFVRSNGGKLNYSQTKQNYESLRKLMKRNFKGASPYSYRHQVASDMKASGLDKNTIATFLGHSNDKSQAHYGYKQHGRSKGKVLGAKGTKPIKENATNYQDYQQKKSFTHKLKSALNTIGGSGSSSGSGTKFKI
ncbi:TPA: site-specific integrase [Escherichia coli]|nr:site-specific integrase [Morganella morganii]HEA1123219.1 site-specific integrase [Escherichia coli]